jgi:hypothetical protein
MTRLSSVVVLAGIVSLGFADAAWAQTKPSASPCPPGQIFSEDEGRCVPRPPRPRPGKPPQDGEPPIFGLGPEPTVCGDPGEWHFCPLGKPRKR